jgi:cellulose synthase/poly-beta-1,6-N-acetylglucosamine synthase-like glycosyltransferase
MPVELAQQDYRTRSRAAQTTTRRRQRPTQPFQFISRFEGKEPIKYFTCGIIVIIFFVIYTAVTIFLTVYLVKDKIFSILMIFMWVLWGLFLLMICACFNSAIIYAFDFVGYYRTKKSRHISTTIDVVVVTIDQTPQHEAEELHQDPAVLYTKELAEEGTDDPEISTS